MPRFSPFVKAPRDLRGGSSLSRQSVKKPARWSACVAVAAFVVVALWFCLRGIGVWPPDIVSGKGTLLASAESESGERFKIVQFWGIDFYTTQLEHIRPDGLIRKSVIDADDDKRWKCSAEVVEAEKTVVVSFPERPLITNYRWDLHRFVAPAGREPLRFEIAASTATK